MVRIVLGAVLAAAALFVWGALFWMVLPFGDWVLKPLPNDEAVTKALNDNLPANGVYIFPGWDQASGPEALEAAMAKHRRGPIGQIIYAREGAEPMAPGTFLAGYLQMLASALLAAVLLRAAAPASFLARVAFAAALGLFAVVTVDVSNVIWFRHPWSMVALNGAYNLGGWLLAGLVLGAFVRPTTPAAASSNGALALRDGSARRSAGVSST